MTCPDWPLCRGDWCRNWSAGWSGVDPPRDRVAVGFVIVAASSTGWRGRRRVAGVVPTLPRWSAHLRASGGGRRRHHPRVQQPAFGRAHWGVAMLLLAALGVLALLAVVAPPGRSGLRRSAARSPVPAHGADRHARCATPPCASESFVSSSGAGLACDVPACDGALAGSDGAAIGADAASPRGGIFFVRRCGGQERARSGIPRPRLGLRRRGRILRCCRVRPGDRQRLWRMPVPLREAHAAERGSDVYRIRRLRRVSQRVDRSTCRSIGRARTLHAAARYTREEAWVWPVSQSSTPRSSNRRVSDRTSGG